MSGVTDRESYSRQRIELPLLKMQWLSRHFLCEEALKRSICESILWLQAREKIGVGKAEEV